MGKWLKKNKVYFEIISIIVLTISTTYALWNDSKHQNRTYELQELDYLPDFKIEFGYVDTISPCDNISKEMYVVEIVNNGYPIEFKNARLVPFVSLYNGKDESLLKLNQNMCNSNYNTKKGSLYSFRADYIFEEFERKNDSCYNIIEQFLSKDRLAISRIDYILQISYKNYANEYLDEYFSLSDNRTFNKLTEEEADEYLSIGGVAYSMNDLTPDFLAQQFLK